MPTMQHPRATGVAASVSAQDALITSALGLWKCLGRDDEQLLDALAEFDMACAGYLLALIADVEPDLYAVECRAGGWRHGVES